MTIQEIYDLAVKMGIEADPRGEKFVRERLSRLKKEFKDLPEKKKRYFDNESLINPYSDSRLFTDNPRKNVKKVLAGIDANGTEILLADRLNQKGEGIDLVIGHHPEGAALASLHDVMELQVDMYAAVGVPVNISDAVMGERIKDVALRFHPFNHTQAIDIAKLLGMPLMTLHTIWDNMGNQFMQKYFKNKEFDTVGEVVDSMLEIPEYQEAEKGKAGPLIVSGSEKSRAGKVAVFFTGGTNPAKEIYVELGKTGIGTIVDMHMNSDTIKELKKLHINVINAGHMSSDSIGANLFFDVLESKGIEVVACSGLIRVKRKVKS
jgi:hypothetical protein